MKEMKIVYLALALLGLSAISAMAEQIRVVSPTKTQTAIFERETEKSDYRLIVHNDKGEEVYKSKPIDLQLDETSVIWNKASDRLAFSCGTPFQMNCYVLTLKDKSAELVLLPSPQGNWDNFYQRPIKWVGSILHLHITGPHAGKAEGYSYSGVMTVSFSDEKAPLKVIAEKIQAIEPVAEVSGTEKIEKKVPEGTKLSK